MDTDPPAALEFAPSAVIRHHRHHCSEEHFERVQDDELSNQAQHRAPKYWLELACLDDAQNREVAEVAEAADRAEQHEREERDLASPTARPLLQPDLIAG